MDYYKVTEDEILNNANLKVYLVENNIDLYNDIARIMLNKLKENNQNKVLTSQFILPIGPIGQYERFARICNLENLSCKNLIIIIMDEYLDENNNLLPKNNILSFRGSIEKNLLKSLRNDLGLKKENIFYPTPHDTNKIEKIINTIGGIDICFGGIGINGHIAFNEPMNENEIKTEEFKELKTRILDISNETIIINSLKFGGITDIFPKKCVTIGMHEIFLAKELRFYLEHNWQSAVLRKTIFENPTPSFPATFIKEHPNSSITITRNVLRSYLN